MRAVTDLAIIACGGIGTAADATAALHAGAAAIAIGTLLMRTDESGASATHQAALADPRRTETVVTRAFTGRPARALRNEFTDQHSDEAPFGYPAVHYLTTRAAQGRGRRQRP